MLVCAVAVLWLASIRSVIQVVAVQGIALGLVAVVLGVHLHDVGLLAAAVVVLVVKGVVIPVLLGRANGVDAGSRESRPLVNVPASLVVSAALIVLAFVTCARRGAIVGTPAGALVPVGIATLLIGFFVLVARRRPIFQIVGLLMVDNGIALTAFLVTAGFPFLIELGVSFDVLLGVVVLMVLSQRLRIGVRRRGPRRAPGAARLMLLVLILVLPVLGGAAIAGGQGRRWTAWVAVATNGAVLALGILAAVRVVRARSDRSAPGGAARRCAERVHGDRHRRHRAPVLVARRPDHGPERKRSTGSRRRATLYGVLVQAFVAFMLLAVLAANVGVLWVAVEATTIVTVFLVGHRRTRGSLEAAWKYIVICSVGIALAFLGTVLVYLAALHAGGHSAHALDWTSLVAHAHRFDPSLMRLAFGLLVLGYGTKVGLAPMHSWLPDAHSQAPAPVSALMSGVLLTVAFYAILRFKAVTDLPSGPASPAPCS